MDARVPLYLAVAGSLKITEQVLTNGPKALGGLIGAILLMILLILVLFFALILTCIAIAAYFRYKRLAWSLTAFLVAAASYIVFVIVS